MYTITGIKSLATRYATMDDAIRAFVEAGCPNGEMAAPFAHHVDSCIGSVGLFPALPDRFTGLSRAEARAAYAAGLRPWSYAEYWTAYLAARAA